MIVHPAAACAPQDVPELQNTIRRANEQGEALAVEGGKTLRGMGRPLTRAHRALSTLGLRKINSYESSDLTISVESGLTIRALRAALAEHKQFIPVDVPRAHEATVGGALASGWLGPRRHLFGRPRDYLIGSKIVLADGTLAAAGGMVVKNVAGYDMSRLYVGSFGTLGVLASANFKTAPMLTHARAFLLKLPEGTRLRAMAQVQALPVPVSAALWIHGFKKSIDGEEGDDGRMFVLLEGSSALVDRATRDLRSALGRGGVPETTVIDAGAYDTFDRVLDACTASIAERSITYRLLGTAQEIDLRVRTAYQHARTHELIAESIVDVMNGDVFLRVNGKDANAFSERIETFDDALHLSFPKGTIVAGDSPMRPSLQVWGELPNAIDRMRALKDRFDPKHTLNPGRFIGDI